MYRCHWPGQKLYHKNSGCTKVANHSSRLSKTLYMEGNISSRATKQEEGLEILKRCYDFLLHQRHPIPPPWTSPPEIPRTKSTWEEDLQSAWQRRCARCTETRAQCFKAWEDRKDKVHLGSCHPGTISHLHWRTAGPWRLPVHAVPVCKSTFYLNSSCEDDCEMWTVMSRIWALPDRFSQFTKIVLVHKGNLLPGHDPRTRYLMARSLSI